MDDKIAAAIQEQAQKDMLSCGNAFEIAEKLGVTPLSVGKKADALDVKLTRCQLGLFGYPERNRIVEPAEAVSQALEQAIEEGLVLGRLPCAVAWALANRFQASKRDVANAAEALGVRIGQCQLGAF